MELIDALKVIQQECVKNNNCTKCPLRNADDYNGDSYCHLRTYIPSNWKLVEPIIPRVFE